MICDTYGNPSIGESVAINIHLDKLLDIPDEYALKDNVSDKPNGYALEDNGGNKPDDIVVK